MQYDVWARDEFGQSCWLAGGMTRSQSLDLLENLELSFGIHAWMEEN